MAKRTRIKIATTRLLIVITLSCLTLKMCHWGDTSSFWNILFFTIKMHDDCQTFLMIAATKTACVTLSSILKQQALSQKCRNKLFLPLVWSHYGKQLCLWCKFGIIWSLQGHGKFSITLPVANYVYFKTNLVIIIKLAMNRLLSSRALRMQDSHHFLFWVFRHFLCSIFWNYHGGFGWCNLYLSLISFSS